MTQNGGRGGATLLRTTKRIIVSGPLLHGPPLTAMASPFLLELFVFALYGLRLPFDMGLFQIYEWSSW